MTTVIDGKAYAQQLRSELKDTVAALKRDHSLVPGLAVVLVGEDPASQVYVRNKAKQTVEVGMHSFEHKLDADTSEETLLELVNDLNVDDQVHGILVQLPLPDHINESRIINAVSHDKDVDGFHLVNVGRLNTDGGGVVPCTPLGCLMMLKSTLGNLSGLNAVIVGRSNIVGKPMAALLLRESCTVTIAHSRTADLPELCRGADILVAAVGRPQMVTGEWVKPGAAVIDVGINRIEVDGKNRLVGDVDYDSAFKVAGSITPVPGGVGPMTIACLLHNTVQQARRINGLAD
ncbi:MAG: bifunctional methylenetetrahydrofolate dehydrogenase/methenyltetrahydrofolate cyclohydrolase FolD [Granulosicoccus sp.]|nr:bifunctional methylenetetrahydrofolate dehydrogenase/methenyltetrahydrofolate cyclohydrolase FolD [Granulosicoccus sp.]